MGTQKMDSPSSPDPMPEKKIRGYVTLGQAKAPSAEPIIAPVVDETPIPSSAEDSRNTRSLPSRHVSSRPHPLSSCRIPRPQSDACPRGPAPCRTATKEEGAVADAPADCRRVGCGSAEEETTATQEEPAKMEGEGETPAIAQDEPVKSEADAEPAKEESAVDAVLEAPAAADTSTETADTDEVFVTPAEERASFVGSPPPPPASTDITSAAQEVNEEPVEDTPAEETVLVLDVEPIVEAIPVIKPTRAEEEAQEENEPEPEKEEAEMEEEEDVVKTPAPAKQSKSGRLKSRRKSDGNASKNSNGSSNRRRKEEPQQQEVQEERDEEAEEEAARKQRVAERMAKMGGFNPFGARLYSASTGRPGLEWCWGNIFQGIGSTTCGGSRTLNKKLGHWGEKAKTCRR
ncbi:hypothetical protein B0H14DRAFT_2565580 [Mycena olivaceomarginata]|nr:hypothetical protein B0H14DRAFT_2565580 [Mycena olivaceomarginata]